MSQERLAGLSIISINFQVGEEISYDDIIDEFASRKARKQHFLNHLTVINSNPNTFCHTKKHERTHNAYKAQIVASLFL